MSRNLGSLRACALALLFVPVTFTASFAHCFVGARFFPATLAIDDPCVADELSVPTVDWFRTGDSPPASEWDVSAELSKRITEDFGISIGDTWSQIHQPGGFTAAGFSDLETTFQYQLLKDPNHELAMLLGVIVDWGGTGAVHCSPLPTISGKVSAIFPTAPDGSGPSRSPGRSDIRSRRSPMTSRKMFLSHRSSRTVRHCNTACRI
jgi:hypothetical protein